MDESEELACPLCTELLDATDRACEFCQCGYSMCLWCWHQLMENAAKENLKGRCPNCRSVYDKQKITEQAMAPSQLEEVAKEAQKNRKPERKVSGVQARPRRDLASVRVVQRNLVYVVGLSMDICHEDTLRTSEFFGQFGKPVKVSVNRSMPTGMAHAKGGASGSAYVTFRRSQEAQRCVETIDGIIWSGRVVRACFGTTKYCNAFLKGIICNNSDCLYLHAVAEEADSFTKEAMLSGAPAFSKFASLTQLAPKARVGALPMHSATASSAMSQPIAPPAPLGVPSLQRTPSSLLAPGPALPSLNGDSCESGGGTAGPSGSGSGGNATPESPTTTAAAAAATGSATGSGQGSWAAVFAAPSTPVAVPPPRPPGESASDQEWPSLGGAAPPVAGATSSSPTPSGAAAPSGSYVHNVAVSSGSMEQTQQPQQQPEMSTDAGSGDTMAAQIARAHAVSAKQAGVGARTAAKKAQQGMIPTRLRTAKTLVPPPPPLMSTSPSEPVLGPTALALSGLHPQSKSTTLQLKKPISRVLLPPRSASEDVPSQPDERFTSNGAATSSSVSPGLPSSGNYLPEHLNRHNLGEADAGLSNGMSLASTATSTPQPSSDGSYSAPARPRSKPAGPPPGFDRGPPRALPQRDGSTGPPQMYQQQQAQQQQQQAQMSGDYGVQYGAQQPMMGGGGASAHAAGRTQSRFSFARGSGRDGPMYSENGGYGPGAEQQQWQPHVAANPGGAPPSYAPLGNGFSGEALLRQLQQNGANGSERNPLHRDLQTGPALQDPSIVSVRPAAPGMQAPGIGSYMPGLTSGFRPGSRGPPPGFTGYLPQQMPQQAGPQVVPQTQPLHSAPPHLNGGGGFNDGPAAQNGFPCSSSLHMNGGAAAEATTAAVPAHEMSPGAKGRRRKGKAAAPVVSAVASQFPASASLHDSETLAGRLQQAKERFYSLNS